MAPVNGLGLIVAVPTARLFCFVNLYVFVLLLSLIISFILHGATGEIEIVAFSAACILAYN